MFGYRRPAPNQAMLISGGRRGQKGAPFRVVTGRGAVVLPIFHKVRYLTLAKQKAELAEQCVTSQGITLLIRADVEFKVGNDHDSIIKAARRFQSDQQQMPVLAGRIFAAHLQPVTGSMTLEEIVRDRRKLETEVLNGSKSDMAAIGLTTDSVQLQSIDDMGAGYIKAMAAPIQAAIIAQARAAQARADQEWAEQKAAREQAARQADKAQAAGAQQDEAQQDPGSPP